MAQQYYAGSRAWDLTLSQDPGTVTTDLIISNLRRMIENQAEEDEEELSYPEARERAERLFWENADEILSQVEQDEQLIKQDEEMNETLEEEFWPKTISEWAMEHLDSVEWD